MEIHRPRLKFPTVGTKVGKDYCVYCSSAHVSRSCNPQVHRKGKRRKRTQNQGYAALYLDYLVAETGISGSGAKPRITASAPISVKVLSMLHPRYGLRHDSNLIMSGVIRAGLHLVSVEYTAKKA